MVWTFLSFCYGKHERGTTGRFSGPFIDEPIDRVAKRFFHIATRWRICRCPPLRDLPHARVQPLHPEILRDASARDSAPEDSTTMAIRYFFLSSDPLRLRCCQTHIAAVSNHTRSAAGVEGVTDLLDAELIASPEYAPPADAPQGTFVAVCDQKTQAVYDAIWARLKK